MGWVCAEPSRFRTSDNSDERFHVQRDVRRARTSLRTSRNGTGMSAWHSSKANPARRAGQKLPATPGSVVAHSSAGNARVRVSPSAHRTRRRQRRYPVYRQVIARPSRPALAACCSSWRAAPDPSQSFAGHRASDRFEGLSRRPALAAPRPISAQTR
jgi:hypothetical protein